MTIVPIASLRGTTTISEAEHEPKVVPQKPPPPRATPAAASAYLVAARAASPRAYTTPTLPPGVSFIEEPSGIKIYVGSRQLAGTVDPEAGSGAKPSP